MAVLIEEFKARIDSALKVAVVGMIAAAALVAAFTSFAVVLFLWTLQTYGLIEAWLVLGVLFFIVALVCGVLLLALRRPRERERERERETAKIFRVLQEPAVIAAGLQTVRAIGPRQMLPLLLIGAVTAGLLMARENGRPRSRRRKDEAPGQLDRKNSRPRSRGAVD